MSILIFFVTFGNFLINQITLSYKIKKSQIKIQINITLKF